MSKEKESLPVLENLKRPFNRRDFLKFQMKGALWLAAGTSGLILPDRGIADSAPDVVEVTGLPGAAARAAVELLGGIGNIVKPGNRVLIKPNMSFPNRPEEATTTNPEVVRELAVMCKEAGAANILIADYPLFSPKTCLSRTGIQQACKEIPDTSVIGVSSGRFFRKTDIPGAEIMADNGILKESLKADVLIAVPVAKSHNSTGVSLALKGMMGLVWDRGMMHKKGLSSSIVDMCTVLKADLAIIDGTRVLSTNGPRGPGRVLRENKIIASRDMVAADAYATSIFKWYGKRYKPKQVTHIRKAHERGLGRMDIENMTVKKLVR